MCEKTGRTKNGKPVTTITPQTADQASDSERQSVSAALRKTLREKRPTDYRVGKITEDDKYGG